MRTPLIASLALALVATAAPATASPRLLGIPARVRAGTDLRIAWTGLGPEAHEAELEISLAGGRWVRISPELDAREGGFTWHVPAGLAGPARLRLEYGGESFEAEGDVSMPFMLEPGAVANRVPVSEMSEWWCLGRQPRSLPGPHVAGAASLRQAGQVLALSPERERMARLDASPTGRSPVRAPAVTRGDGLLTRTAFSRSNPLRI